MRLFYQFLLAGLIGLELTLGILVAPLIFHPEKVGVINTLNQFQSGLIMTQLFVQMGYILLGVSLFSLIFELFSFKKHLLRPILSISIILLACVFVFYFTDFILQAQNLGESATQSKEFRSIHKWGEWTLKLIVALQILLFFLPFQMRRRYEIYY